jgi:archaellum component FlaF (FlaF/FlaG flagellin family)
MGFSTSAVVVILTASLMYMAAMFYPQADMSYQRVLKAEKNFNEKQNEKLNTKITITSWASDGNITVYNNGSTTLNSSKLNVLQNGIFKSSSSYTVNPGGVWTPRTSINVTLSGVINDRVKIITANGAADYAIK